MSVPSAPSDQIPVGVVVVGYQREPGTLQEEHAPSQSPYLHLTQTVSSQGCESESFGSVYLILSPTLLKTLHGSLVASGESPSFSP